MQRLQTPSPTDINSINTTGENPKKVYLGTHRSEGRRAQTVTGTEEVYCQYRGRCEADRSKGKESEAGIG